MEPPCTAQLIWMSESPLLEFASAKLVKVLDANERLKYTALHVLMKSQNAQEPVDTVILAEKTSFPSLENLEAIFGTGQQSSSTLKLIESNDIYYRYLIGSIDGVSHTKLTIIHPATPKHIAKYTKQSRLLVKETPELYKTVVEPYISANPASRLQWVQNILEERSEMDSLVAADRDPVSGFYLLPDSKWDRRTLSGLYLLAICKDPSIRSIRDIDGTKHLNLLQGIQKAVNEIVPEKYPGVSGSQLRCFIHYQPTYYHFHVHVVHVDMVDGIGALVGQAILLDDVIDNLQTFGPDFYQRKTMTYTLGCNHDLYPSLSTHL